MASNRSALGDAVTVFIALGSNLGDRNAHLAFARDEIAHIDGCSIVAASSIEETAPLGGLDQPQYLNQMVAVRCTIAPAELLAELQAIERRGGRDRSEKWASRTLDLDIVAFDDVTSTDPALRLPHPGLANRDFWQRELAELREAP